MRIVQPSLRFRMAVLYAALVLIIGAAILTTSYVLFSRALQGSTTLKGTVGTKTVYVKNVSLVDIRPAVLNYLVSNGFLYFGIIVLSGALGGYLLARQALLPVARITATARRLSTKTLSERIGLGGPDDELRELADTFDDMLGRLDAAFSSQRRFVANASHELRTPLAVIQTELDVSLADAAASADELRRMGEVVRDAANRAQRLVDALLSLARLQGREGMGLETSELVILNQLIPNAVAAAEAEATLRDITITAEGDPVLAMGDPRLLERVIGNLVENAVRYNVTGGWVRVHTETVGIGNSRLAKLIVMNSGPIIRPDEVEGLFDAFRRGGRARTGQRGAGLGLSIVRAIVDAHDGSIASSALADGGLRVEISLPAAVAQSTPALL
jgi:signal transduction histidine kinase